MDQKDIKAAMGKPHLLRLKEVAKGIQVGVVFGERVLVRKIQPFTEMDRVEESGFLVIPETVKEANTPPPSTGIVVQLGTDLMQGDYPTARYDQLKPGTAIMFSRYAGSDVIVDEEEFKILDVKEIMCTLEKKEDVE